MRSTRTLFISICLAAAATTCLGQANKSKPKPDLSGTWEFDQKRSNVGKSNSSTPPEQIKITHHDPELKVERKVVVNGLPEVRALAYYTDGRGETNPTTAWLTTNPGSKSDRPSETKSKTMWSGDKVVTRAIFSPRAGSAVIHFEINVEWRVSSDGKTLTETTHTIARPDAFSNSVFVAGRGNEFKAVYKLISK